MFLKLCDPTGSSSPTLVCGDADYFLEAPTDIGLRKGALPPITVGVLSEIESSKGKHSQKPHSNTPLSQPKTQPAPGEPLRLGRLGVPKNGKMEPTKFHGFGDCP